MNIIKIFLYYNCKNQTKFKNMKKLVINCKHEFDSWFTYTIKNKKTREIFTVGRIKVMNAYVPKKDNYDFGIVRKEVIKLVSPLIDFNEYEIV